MHFALLGTTPIANQTASRLALAGFDVRPVNIPDTGSKGPGLTEPNILGGAAAPAAVITLFGSIPELKRVMQDLLPTLGEAIWIDLSPISHRDGQDLDALAHWHGVPRLAAPLIEQRGTTVITAPAVLDLRCQIVCEPVLAAAADLILRTHDPEYGAMSLDQQALSEAQIAELEYDAFTEGDSPQRLTGRG
ncbi:hypothetical protein ACFXDE_02255 [Kitasatospora sp. NPDC059408]|uniref:hypothetical protein n=1 Tax=Kitasatospora sp. NPDC059408 TaxID=3346823 RepID=UPI0036B0D5DD